MVTNPPRADGQNYISAVFPSMAEGTTLSTWDDSSQQYITSTFLGVVCHPANITLAPGLRRQRGSESPINPKFHHPAGGRVTTDLGLPVISGDIVYRMVNGNNVTYTYNNGAWSPSEPSVAIGESFWSKKNVGFWWHRNFLVWPGWP